MEKRHKISWGVSFGSVALVAGMVSYLGLSNNGKAANPVNAQQNSNYPFQQSQGSLGAGQGNQSDSFNQTFGNDNSAQFNQGDNSTQFNPNGGSSQFNQNDGTSGGNSQLFGGNDQGGGQSFGRHHGFATTTGGS